MMNKTLQARMDSQLMDKAEGILKDLGLNRSTALKMFYQQIVLNDGLPFEVKKPDKPNNATLQAMHEDLSKTKAYNDSKELWDELGI
ncbi:type II toxin-antitoxin system RelB/DinJ family antitoxin [Lactobacillus sp. ESL0684]|uniref:type II toxin-antitoxin system RelB/DinJ family antitoxin n=1 Tax=unclassified Lactobacillus TaxID=2620435 RepID=UPI0023F924A3|nr:MULTISPECIES: type II toxin-antitoxin system RelB/DinJ family antitoxin [unclassified Lactobacillus]WEV39961.1 type II toxin-antitoxin system RelB/DinJ family antitoxin [Lactobacillus sp. ESL0681]WEV43497.1 type II toxin-antitoxin system RelB/DinJ family antitoxin [Lactobacillus sp. ESL0684]